MPSQVANIDYTNYRYGWHGWHDMCQCCHRYQIAVHATMLYGSTAVPVKKLKLWNQQHVLFCSFAIKETNFVLILVTHTLQFSEVAAATTMTDLSRHEYDWRLWLKSHKYDWPRLDKIRLAAATWWRRLRGLYARHLN